MAEKYQLYELLPNDFFNKAVNEPFVQWVMQHIVADGVWRGGDPNKGEPDFFCDNYPFEVTFASDHTKKSAIQRLSTVTYNSKSIMQDAWRYMETSIKDKCSKTYSVSKVNVCVLCPFLFCDHLCDTSGKLDSNLFLWMHQDDIQRFRNTYITARVGNIYLIFPCKDASWWVLSVNDCSLNNVQLTKKEVISGKYPCFITSEAYPEVIAAFANNSNTQ